MMLSILLSTNLLENPSDFMIFLGRFHPVVVHLPIGFIVVAVLAQWVIRRPKFNPIAPFLSYLWGLGALSAAFAIVFGYLLSLSGDYDPDSLFWHKWSGVAVFVFSLLCYFASKNQKGMLHSIQWVFVTLTMGTIIYTGHLGGNLTHGSTYLWEYAPNTVRSMAGLRPKTPPRPKVTVLDSADVYLDLISPMMERKCISCHNNGKKKGDLVLTSHATLMRGGDGGKAIIPGDFQASELYRRITLPEGHEEFMPAEGKRPLTGQEIAIIEWWIASGAPSKGSITGFAAKQEILNAITNYLGLDTNKVLSSAVSPADQNVIDSLVAAGFIVNRLMKDNYLLEANFSLSENPIETTALESLAHIKDQLIWLDLSNAQLTDASLQQISRLENLLKLDLSGNSITDKGIAQLSRLKNLESLNLYDTQVAEGVLQLVPKLPHLQRLYLWQTQINDSILSRIQSENPRMRVIGRRTTEEQEL